MLTLILALILLILSKGTLEYETVLRDVELGGLLVGRILGRSVEITIARYRPGRAYVLARAW